MKPAPSPRRRAPTPSITPGERIAEIIAALTARMTEVQRHAFQAKMSDLDRERGLSPFTVTLGSA